MSIFGPWQTGTPSENSSELEEYLKKLGLDEEKIADLQRQLNALREFKEWNYGQPKSVTSGSSDRVQPRPAPKEEQVPLKQEVPPRRYRGFWDKVSPEDLHSEETKGFRDLTMKEVPEAARVFGKAAVSALPLATVASGAIADDVARDIEQVLKATPSTPNIPKGGKTLQEFLKVREEDPWHDTFLPRFGVLAKPWIGEPDEIVERNKAANFLGQIIGSFPLALSAVRPFVQAGAPLAKKAITLGISNTVENLPMATVIALNSGDKSTAEKTAQVALQSALTFGASTLLGIPVLRKWQPDPGPTRLDLGPETGTPLQQLDRLSRLGLRPRLNEGRATIPLFSGADEIASAIREAPGILGIQRKIDAEVAKQGEPIIAERGKSKLEQLIPEDEPIQRDRESYARWGERQPERLAEVGAGTVARKGLDEIELARAALERQRQEKRKSPGQAGWFRDVSRYRKGIMPKVERAEAIEFINSRIESIRARFSEEYEQSGIKLELEEAQKLKKKLPEQDWVKNLNLDQTGLLRFFGKGAEQTKENLNKAIPGAFEILNNAQKTRKLLIRASGKNPGLNHKDHLALQILLRKSTDELVPLFRAIEQSPNSARTIDALHEAAPAYMSILKTVSNAASEWGRTGKAMQLGQKLPLAQTARITPPSKDIGEMPEALKVFDLFFNERRDPSAISKLASDWLETNSTSGPTGSARYLEGRALADKIFGVADSWMKSNMLSGLKTAITTLKSGLIVNADHFIRVPLRGIADKGMQYAVNVFGKNRVFQDSRNAEGKVVQPSYEAQHHIYKDMIGFLYGVKAGIPTSIRSLLYSIVRQEQTQRIQDKAEFRDAGSLLERIPRYLQLVLAFDQFNAAINQWGHRGALAVQGMSLEKVGRALSKEAEVQKAVFEALPKAKKGDIRLPIPLEGESRIARVARETGKKPTKKAVTEMTIEDFRNRVANPEIAPVTVKQLDWIKARQEEAAYMNPTMLSRLGERMRNVKPLAPLKEMWMNIPSDKLRGFLDSTAEGRPLRYAVPFLTAGAAVTTKVAKMGTAPVWGLPVAIFRFYKTYANYSGIPQKIVGTAGRKHREELKIKGMTSEEADNIMQPVVYTAMGAVVWELLDSDTLTYGPPPERRDMWKRGEKANPETGIPYYAFKVGGKYVPLDELDDTLSSILKGWIDVRDFLRTYYESPADPLREAERDEMRDSEKIWERSTDILSESMKDNVLGNTFFRSLNEFLFNALSVLDPSEADALKAGELARRTGYDALGRLEPKLFTSFREPPKRQYDFLGKDLEQKFLLEEGVPRRDFFGKKIEEPAFERITGLSIMEKQDIDKRSALMAKFEVPPVPYGSRTEGGSVGITIKARDVDEKGQGEFTGKKVERLEKIYGGVDPHTLAPQEFEAIQKLIKSEITESRSTFKELLNESVVNPSLENPSWKEETGVVRLGKTELTPAKEERRQDIQDFKEVMSENKGLAPGINSIWSMANMLFDKFQHLPSETALVSREVIEQWNEQKEYKENVVDFADKSIRSHIGSEGSRVSEVLFSVLDQFEAGIETLRANIEKQKAYISGLDSRPASYSPEFAAYEKAQKTLEGLKEKEKFLLDFKHQHVFRLAGENAEREEDERLLQLLRERRRTR